MDGCWAFSAPDFILDELQTKAATGAGADRERAQRGLDSLEQMQKSSDIQVSIHDNSISSNAETMHSRLLETTRLLGARLMTVDENVAKVAKIQGLDVLNINDLDEALKPTVAVGQRVRIALVRTGKEDHQAVGYLPDGTMIVTNHAVAKMGSTADVVVVSTLQTASGTMVFAELYKPS
jgi:uncharacterized protein YacL